MEKLNCKSLMIGDWVSYNGTHIKVENVYEDCINFQHDIPFVQEEFLIEQTEIEPILLTEEILEKNGFTKSTPPPGIHARCYDLNNKKDMYNLTIADYNQYKRLLLDVDSEDSECFNIKCDYVHELQHALRLCNVNKEIIL